MRSRQHLMLPSTVAPCPSPRPWSRSAGVEVVLAIFYTSALFRGCTTVAASACPLVEGLYRRPALGRAQMTLPRLIFAADASQRPTYLKQRYLMSPSISLWRCSLPSAGCFLSESGRGAFTSGAITPVARARPSRRPPILSPIPRQSLPVHRYLMTKDLCRLRPRRHAHSRELPASRFHAA